MADSTCGVGQGVGMARDWNEWLRRKWNREQETRARYSTAPLTPQQKDFIRGVARSMTTTEEEIRAFENVVTPTTTFRAAPKAAPITTTDLNRLLDKYVIPELRKNLNDQVLKSPLFTAPPPYDPAKTAPADRPTSSLPRSQIQGMSTYGYASQDEMHARNTREIQGLPIPGSDEWEPATLKGRTR